MCSAVLEGGLVEGLHERTWLTEHIRVHLPLFARSLAMQVQYPSHWQQCQELCLLLPLDSQMMTYTFMVNRLSSCTAWKGLQDKATEVGIVHRHISHTVPR